MYFSALCGIIATTVKGGNIFKFEDNVCSVGTYTGVPAQFEDDQVSVSNCSSLSTFIFPGTSVINLHEACNSYNYYTYYYSHNYNYNYNYNHNYN